MTSSVDAVQVISHRLEADAEVPNNPRLPLLAYPGAVRPTGSDPASIFERLFEANDWVGCWRDGIFAFHHYHSTAHEVLGIYCGTARAQLGGENGITLTLNPGDVLIIPAGVAHKRLSPGAGLGVVGAYPSGQSPDTCRAGAGACQQAATRVARVPVPRCDPVYGPGGPMCEHWIR
ncbi:MAG: hypothetical protein GTO67_13055 [Gammaproteobacteria bacterium]|nr:hypothetical protein [Gammaproteobacteria bacterium]NIM74198.1 hypothetical protein [Gammaproteobacteria bacterium]NIN39497.1 hypothetical protein [Gammaproteobacteria bacterium]NIO25970.1 hypothetical protein [Gammaproteobacteria bacterium]NIO66603.1 hypothetical protein [Gammaproteobacteria bacterium]